MEPVDLRKMVSSLADSFNKYNDLFSKQELLFIEHCQIKLDNDEQLINQEISQLNDLFIDRGIETMRRKEEEKRVEREIYEQKEKAFRNRVGVDPLEIIDTMLGTNRISQDTRDRLELFRRELKLDEKLSGLELKILFETWRDFTIPLWMKAFQWMWDVLKVAREMDLFTLAFRLAVLLFICFFLWWVVSPGAKEIERKSQGDHIAKIHCTGGYYTMRTVEDRGDTWEGFTTDRMFIQAPKAVCSIEWPGGKPRGRGETP